MSELDNILDDPDAERPQWTPSRAVVAQGERAGAVLWCTEDSLIEQEISNVSEHLADLGLDDAPRGVSIWEGDFVWRPGTYECPQDGHSEPVGKFRAPTDDEWAAIRAGRSPFSSEPEGSTP